MPPFLDSVVPKVGYPGDRFTTRLGGDVFTRVTEVSFGSGVQVVFFNIIDDGTIEAKIQIERDAVPGPRDVILTDPSGPGNPLIAGFRVG